MIIFLKPKTKVIIMIMSGFLARNKSNLVFIGLLIVMFFVYRYPHSIQKGPFSIHYWRQSSGLSIALNYEKEDIGFFEPTIHWTGDLENGKTVVEFPVIYYLAGKLWKVFGHHEFIFRLINLLILYTGLFYLFMFLREFLKSDFWAIVIPLILFTSPTLVYYGNNTLMNTPAFGLVLIAAYYYWHFIQTGKANPLYVSMSIFMLAGLLKLTALILFTSILLIHLIAIIPRLKKVLNIKNLFRPVHLVPFAIVIIINVAWVQWVKAYNAENISGIFLQGLNPIWKTTLSDGIYVGRLFYYELLGTMLSIPAIYICMLLHIWLLFNHRRANPLLLSLSVITLGGTFLYFLLFFKAMTVHDYYLINLIIVFPLILVTFLDFLRNNYPSMVGNRAFKGVILIGLVLMVYGTMVRQRARYDLSDTFVKHSIILSIKQKNLYESYHHNYRYRFQALESIQPYLRELGIKRENKVLSMPDGTPNYTLYLMDQKGITDFGYGRLKDGERIDHFIATGVKYLVINDPKILSVEYLKPFLQDKIGEYKNVSIYRLPDLNCK